MHKYHAKRTKVEDRSYGSKIESQYALFLDSAKKKGDLWFYLEQVPFRLPGNITYRLDFMEFWDNGTIVFTEVKGMMTTVALNKMKQVQEIYEIEIKLVRKPCDFVR